MTNSKSLREHFHELMNKIQGIAVNASSFAYLYSHYPDTINASTKEKLFKVLDDIGLYYDMSFGVLNSASQAINKSVASKEWLGVQNAIGKELNDIYELLNIVKSLSVKIQEVNYKNDIINITKKMSRFQGKCDTVAKIIENFKERLISLKIYDNVYN